MGSRGLELRGSSDRSVWDGRTNKEDRMRMRLITLLAFAGLFATALAAGAPTGLPMVDMAAMGVPTTVPMPDRALAEQTAVNSGPSIGWQDGWGSEEQISNNADTNWLYYGNGHKVVVASNGVRHVVWQTSTKKVYYKRYYSASGWTEALLLDTDAYDPSIALDANGTTIHVVWHSYKRIQKCYWHVFYKKCVPGTSGTGGWDAAPTDLCTNHNVAIHQEPTVACAPNRVVVAWYENDGGKRSVSFREFTLGKWQTQVQLATPSSCYRNLPSIAAAGNGDVFVAYYGTQSYQDRDSWDVYVKRRISGVWQSWENVTKTLAYPDSFIASSVEVDPVTGYPHVVCHSYSITVSGTDTSRYYHIYHAYRTGTGWTVPVMITDAGCTDVTPSMFFAGDGSAHLVWRRGMANSEPGIMYMVRDAAGTWGIPSYVSSGPWSDNLPNVTVSSTGNVYAVWMDGRNGPYQIWGRLYTSGSFGPMAGMTVTPRGFALDITPNPVSRRMVVNYSLPAAGNVSLKLYDVRGAVAKTVACGSVLPGSHAVSMDRQGLVRGAYILKLESGASSLTRKLVIE
jgi:hypothetical protein